MRMRTMRRVARPRAIVALVAVVALGVWASVALSGSSGPVLDYSAYVGGKGKANASLSPVTIGWINGQGGPVTRDFPQGTRVVEAAVKMINAELGGVHGHPVKLSECFIAQAEEEGVRCGQ